MFPNRIIFCMVCLLVGSVCFAATLYVDDDAVNDPGPSDPTVSDPLEDGSQVHPFDAIQEAINIADTNDVVLVSDGTYTGDGNRDMDFLGKAITVQSENGPQTCIIDCQGTEETHRAFTFQSGETHESILSGFTITNGYAKYEEIEISPNTLTMGGVFGGAVFCDKTSPFISVCIIQDCFSHGHGGGLAIHAGSPLISDVKFYDNRAGIGFAISGYNSSMTIENCHFIDNSGENNSGCVVDPVSDSPVCLNAGALFVLSENSVVSNCAFSGNKGGLAGGIFSYYAYLSIQGCTFVGNRGVDGNGSIVFLNPEDTAQNEMFLINNCVFFDNYTADGPDLLDGKGIFFDYAIKRTTYDLYKSNYSCFQNLEADLPGIGNIEADPLFVQPGYWDVNDTSDDWSDDIWVEGNYHLKSAGWRWDDVGQQWTWDDVTSPCIDAGNPGMVLGEELMPEDIDPENIRGENIRINMGAYGGTVEASMEPPGWGLLTDLNNNGIVNLDDLTAVAGLWLKTGENLSSDVNRDGSVNLADMALLAQDWLNTTVWY